MRRMAKKDILNFYNEAFKTHEIPLKKESHSAVIRDIIKNLEPIEKSKVLEIGCGSGRIMKLILERKKTIDLFVGIDFSMSALKRARHSFLKNEDVNLVCADAIHLPFKNYVFGNVYSNSFLEHLLAEDVFEVVKEATRILNNNGTIVCYGPNYVGQSQIDIRRFSFKNAKHLLNFFLQWVFWLFGEKKIPSRIPNFDSEHSRYKSDQEATNCMNALYLENYLREIGFKPKVHTFGGNGNVTPKKYILEKLPFFRFIGTSYLIVAQSKYANK